MKHLRRFWNWLLGKTTIDEKIEAKVDEVVEEVKERVDRIKEEVADVKAAAKEVATLGNPGIDKTLPADILISVWVVPSKASIMLVIWVAVMFCPVAIPVFGIVAMCINIINLS